ncbi:MAG: hypothetical protein R6U32_05970 [Candidatus Woesearchaeota archaeon]
MSLEKIRVMVQQAEFMSQDDIEEIKECIGLLKKSECSDGRVLEEHFFTKEFGFPKDWKEYKWYVVQMLDEYCIVTPEEARKFYDRGLI